MMSCDQVTRSVTDFLEHELRLRDRMEFLMHIVMCRGCRAYFEQIRMTIRGLRSLNQPAQAGTSVEALLECFREETRKKGN